MSIIDDYLKNIPAQERKELERIRTIAKSMLPGSEEVITYGMPTIKYKGKSIIAFDAHKNHIGIYPFSGRVLDKIKELDNQEKTKGALREKLDKLLPRSVIEKIITERLKLSGLD
jgi:uncharacterized protein YdhG (YjbR/CyaY superfamily)